MIEAEIRWGTGYDNALSFEYRKGLDDIRTWRRPAPGSRRTRNGAGTTDSWISRRDFVLAGRARWFDLPNWGGLGLQDFLDWAGEGNAFRFIPDRNYPNFYVGDCYLEEPFDNPEPQLETSDGSQSVDIVIRQQAFDFSLAQRGLLFEYVPGKSTTDPSTMLATFTRATTASRIARDQSIATQASGELRDRHFESTVRSTLLEQSRENGWTRSEDLSDAAWTKTECTITANAVVAPDGATTADKTVSFFVEAGDRSWIQANITPKDGNNARTWFNASTGAFGTTAGTHTVRVQAFGGDWRGTWYRPSITFDALAGGTTPSLDLILATGDGNTSYAGNGTAGLYVWGLQVEVDQACESSYIPTAGATVTRSTDAIYFPYAFVPQTQTFYLKFVERGSIATQSRGVFYIGNAGETGARFMLDTDTSLFYRATHGNGSSTVADATLNARPTIGQTVELRVTLATTGAVTLGQSINGATETVTSTSSALTFASAWADTRLYLNSRGGNTPGLNAFQIVRVAAGVKTMAEMRAI